MKLLVLPGTKWQVPLMKKIKSMGHELHVINPVKVDGVYQFADFFYESDIFDYEHNIAYCKDNGIDAVVSDECDIATDVVAILNDKIGANGISVEMAELFTNKYKMREFCRKHNLCPIPYKLCESKDEALSFFRENGPKVIMKPIDSNASHGVFTIVSEEDIERNFNETFSFSRNVKAVLLEKYIEGTEFTVDGLMTENGHHTLAISEKAHYRHNQNIAHSLYFTQESDQFDYNRLRKVNDELLCATGLPYGLTHVEYKCCDGQFYLIEMAARGGGNLISATIAPFMSGVDNYRYLINKTLDKTYIEEITPDIKNDRTAILKFLDLPCAEGKVTGIHGIEYMEQEALISSYKLYFEVGDYIHQPESDSVRIGYYIVCAPSKEEFARVSKEIQEKLMIDVEEG